MKTAISVEMFWSGMMFVIVIVNYKNMATATCITLTVQNTSRTAS